MSHASAAISTSAVAVSLPAYLAHFAPLIGDKRTRTTFHEIVSGIICAGSLVCARIAAKSTILSQAKDPSQRVIRFADGTSTSRSKLDAASLVEQLAQHALARLALTPPLTDIWLIIDGSELRKPYSHAMPDLMKVRDLDGNLVPGYRTINVIAVTPQMRTLLYHHLFSSNEQDFLSEPHEVQLALQQVNKALQQLQQLEQGRAVTWIMDTGFDDIAVWRTIWENDEHLVCRLKHLDRLLEYRTLKGEWRQGDVNAACAQLRWLGSLHTSMEVRLKGQRAAKEQVVTVVLRACPLRLRYEKNVRRAGREGGVGEQMEERLEKEVWLVRVEVEDSMMQPWYLLSDWPVETAEQAVRLFRMYRQRWSVEDSFAFIKGMLGWEEVQMLDLKGIRTLVALGWVAAGYLYEVQGTWTQAEVKWLAKLGGWAERKDRKPGKKVLTRGIQSILDYLLTRAELERYRAEHGTLPPAVTALLGEDLVKDL